MHPCTVMQGLQTCDSGWESWLSSQNRHPIHFQNSKPVSSASKIIPWFLSMIFVLLLEQAVTVYIFNELCYWRSAMDRLTAHTWSAGRLLLPRRCQMKSQTPETFIFTWMKRVTCGRVGSPTTPTSKSSPLKVRTIYCFSNQERMKFHCTYVYTLSHATHLFVQHSCCGKVLHHTVIDTWTFFYRYTKYEFLLPSFTVTASQTEHSERLHGDCHDHRGCQLQRPGSVKWADLQDSERCGYPEHGIACQGERLLL